MSYTTLAQCLVNVRDIREASVVRIVNETDEQTMYSKSVYDACLESASGDEDLFEVMLIMCSTNMERSLIWATTVLARS